MCNTAQAAVLHIRNTVLHSHYLYETVRGTVGDLGIKSPFIIMGSGRGGRGKWVLGKGRELDGE